MSEHDRFHLDTEAKRRWRQRMQERQAVADTQYKIISAELEELEQGSKLSFLSRFFSGEPASLKRAFLRPSWLTILARNLGSEDKPCTSEILKADLAWARIGEITPEGEWHPAFPGLELESVEIQAPLQTSDGPLLPSQVARRHLLGPGFRPSAWQRPSQFEPLYLVCPPRRARDIAARQLLDALQRTLDELLAEAAAEWDEQAAKLAREHRKPTTKRPVTHIPVELVEGDVSSQGDRLQLSVVESTKGIKTVELAPWGSREVRHLASSLASAPLPATHRRRLNAFAKALEREPKLVDGDWSPDMVIRLLAEIGSSSAKAILGGPSGVRWVRDRWTAAAWRRAQEAAPHLLGNLPEDILERFLARAATRARSPEERGPWWSLDDGVAIELLSEVMPAIPLDEIKRVLPDIAKGQKPSRVRAVQQLEARLEGWRPHTMLEALVQAEILEWHPTGIRPANKTLAIFWAARGIVRSKTSAPEITPMRLLDPAWRTLAKELVRQGLPWRDLLPKAGSSPDELKIEAAIWTVSLAAVATDRLPDDIVIPAWATALWAEATGYLRGGPVHSRDHGLRSALEAISRRYRASLPVFEQDPPRQVWDLVHSEAMEPLNRWRTPPTSDERGSRREPNSPWWFSTFESYEEFARQIIHLAPYQVRPNTLPSWDWWRRRDITAFEMLMEELVEAGDEEVRAFVSGALVAEEVAASWRDEEPVDETASRPMRGMRERFETLRRELEARQIWAQHDLDRRLRWAARWAREGKEAWKVFEVLVAECSRLRAFESHDPPPWLELLLEIGRKGSPDERDRWLDWVTSVAHEGFGMGDYALIAMHLAAVTGRLDVLHTIESYPREHGPIVEINYTDGFPGIAGMRRRLSPPGLGRPENLRLTKAFGDLFRHWEELSLRAAFLLHQVGQPDALRDWARRGRRWFPPEDFWVEIERLEGVVRLADVGLFALVRIAREQDDTLSPIGAALVSALAKDQTRTDDPGAFERNLSQMDLHTRCYYDAQPLLGLGLSEGVRELVDAVDHFRFRIPPMLPDELYPLLEQLGGGLLAPWPPGEPHYGGPRGRLLRDDRRERAADLLRIRGDEVLATWWVEDVLAAEAHHARLLAKRDQPITEIGELAQSEGEAERQLPNLPHDLRSKIEGDVSWLRSIWKVFSELPEEIREGEAGRLVRQRLLLDASWRAGYSRERAVLHDNPLPFVIPAGMTADPRLLYRLMQANHPHPDWRPVVRQHLHQAPDPRTRAWWALRLAEYGETAELEVSLEHWLLEDPAPFSGPSRFDQIGALRFGGSMELLDACERLPTESWVREGLERLWNLAVLLPIEKEPYLRFISDRERTVDDLAPTCTLDPGCAGYPGRAPTVLEKLAKQLIERGSHHVIVGTWLNPPDFPATPDPAQEDNEQMGRREYLRHSLSDLFCAHATDEQLHEAFQDESSFWWQVAWELHDRGELTDEEAMRGTGTLDGHFGLIVRHAPKERRERLRFILAERGAMEPTGALLRAAMVELESQASDLDYVDPPARLLVREALELLQAKADAASDEKPKDSAPET